MQTEPALSSCLLLSLALPALLGCSGAQITPSHSTRVEVGEVPAEMRADYQSFAVNCSKCHQLERALAAPVTDVRHWDIYVAKMMRTAGSAIHPDEAPHILRFLYWYTERKQDQRTKRRAPPPAAPRAPGASEPVTEVSREVTAPESGGDTSQTQGESTP